MTKKILSLVFLIVIVFGTLNLSSCKANTPEGVWAKAVEGLAEAKNVSFNTIITLGENTVNLDFAADRSANNKSYDIKVSDDSFTLFTDGSTNYYTVENMNFSIKSGEDSDIFREFLGFTLSNTKRMTFDKADLVDAVLEKEENKKSLVFKVSGEVFKNAFAPDEDITFGETIINAVLDFDNNFKFINVTTTVCGNDFYGLPLMGATKEAKDLVVKIENIDFTGTKKPVEPKDKSDYPESVIFAKIFPNSVFSTMTNSSKIESNSVIEMKVSGQTIKTKTESTTVTQYIDDHIFMRAVSDVYQWNGANKMIDELDEYYDGKEGYLYYSDYSDKYKMKLDEEDVDSDELSKESFIALKQIINDAVINGDTITLDLSLDDLKKIIGEDEFKDSFGNNVTLHEATLKITLKNGFIETYFFDFKINMTTSGVTVLADAEIETKYHDIREDYTVTPPKGYEKYPNLFD